MRPPRVALWLLETLLPAEQRETVIGDLVESYEADVAARPIAARVRFWRESVAAVLQLQLVPNDASAFNPPTWETHMQSFLSDLRHAVRVLARARTFTVVCVATLGIAVGAVAAIFSVVNPVLFAPLPYPDPERIVTVWERDADNTPTRTTYATFTDLRRDARSLESSALAAYWDVNLFGEADSERMLGSRVTWEYFKLLGVRPVLGRDFREEDDTPAGAAVMILSHGLWARRFGSDSAVIGRELDVNGVKRTVIGVMPPTFENVLQENAQIWRPLGYTLDDPSACRTCRHLVMLARVRRDVSVAQAQREIDGLAARLDQQYPKQYPRPGAIVQGLQEHITRQMKPVLLAVLGAATLVLLIAAANVVNLQLARSVRRREEFAVRAALGAGRVRLAQQLFAEGLVLAALGGIAGLGVAAVTLPALRSRLPDTLPRLSAISLSWPTFALVAAVVLIVGIASGMVPTIHAGTRRLSEALRSGTRAMGTTHQRMRATLVIGEVALAMMLLVGAGLLGRSLSRLLNVDAGFDASQLVTMEVQAAGSAYATREAVQANHDRMLDAVRALPGVESAALTNMLPLSGSFDRSGIAAQDKPLENPELAPYADRYTVSADFFSAMRIPILRGRGFTDAEVRDTAARVLLVSDALAKRIWPGEEPLGKMIRIGGAQRPWWRVIGVAANVRHTGLDDAAGMQVYTPERQWFWSETAMTLVVRTKTEPASMVATVREAVRQVDPLQPISRAMTMRGVVSGSTAQRRLGLILFVAFGGVALLLATAGIYGVLSGSVAERTREIGVRSALGATPGSIVGLVLKQSVALAGVGLLVGIGAAIALSRYLGSLLYGIGPTDPVALGTGALVIALVSVAACLAPARRAMRVDPMEALRSD